MDAGAMHAEALRLYQAGQLNESLDALEKARSEFSTQGNESEAASVANDLGVVYYLTGRRDQAFQVLEQALAAYEKLGDVKGQAKAVGNLAQLLNRAGDKPKAETNYLRAADLFHQVGEKGLESDTLRALSQMQLRHGRWLEALGAYDRALAAKGGPGWLRALLQIPLRLVGLRK